MAHMSISEVLLTYSILTSVLGQEYCTGYADIHDKWNTGFYCPPIIPDVPVFCCGTVVLKYCCTLGKPIPGGTYSKGYDSRHSDHEEEEEHDTDNPENIPDIITPDVPTVSSGEEDNLTQNSLFIGIICGLFAIAVLLTIVSCFYCSCCILYKKRRGRLLSGGGLLYGIPTSSSSTTTCGLLSSFGTGTPANVGIATSTCSSGTGGGRIPSSANHASNTTLPNFITTTAPLNPLVDYWSSAGGSSNSSSCGVGTGGGGSSTLIVAATATSLSPPNMIGVHPPHHIHHGSVYHHHHHYTTTSPVIGPGSGTLLMAPVQHLEPPPPYLAVAAVGEQGQCCDSIGATGVISTTRTPQRTNSRGSTGENSSQNSNLIQRQLSLLQNHNANNARNTTSPGNNNLLISGTIVGDGTSHGNSPSISVVASSPPTSTTNTTTGGRGSLPPPYFVEQYRIRNRVRPPRFLSNSGSSANSGSTSSHRSQRTRAQETIQNLLYPLLNSATLSNTASSRHGQRARTAVDTQSEPRRSHFHHRSGNHNENPCVGVGGVVSDLHRSSSDRQQNIVSGGGARSCYMTRDTRGNGEGVVAMNNIINNLSAAPRSSGRTCSGMRTARPITGSAGVVEETTTRSGHGGHSGEVDGRMIIDNLGKILNTEMQLHQRSQRQEGSRSRRSSRDQHNMDSQALPLSTTPNSSSLPSHGSFSSHSNVNNQQHDFIQMESALLTASQQRGDSREVENHLVRTRLENELNENERTLASQATNDDNDTGVMDEEEDDIIMMEDEEDEVIAVVTTTHHRNQDDHEDDEEEVDIIDDLVMGFGGEEEEEYLVEDENSEENSTDKLSESAPNSSVSVSVDASHSHRNNEAKNENRKSGTGSPSSVLAGERGRDEGEDSDNHRRRKQQTRSNSESSSGNGNEARLPPAVHALDFVKTSEKPS